MEMICEISTPFMASLLLRKYPILLFFSHQVVAPSLKSHMSPGLKLQMGEHERCKTLLSLSCACPAKTGLGWDFNPSENIDVHLKKKGGEGGRG